MSKELELTIIQNIKNNNYDIRTIINDNEPYTLYCASDCLSGRCLSICTN